MNRLFMQGANTSYGRQKFLGINAPPNFQIEADLRKKIVNKRISVLDCEPSGCTLQPN
jgi:hypothetical protein